MSRFAPLNRDVVTMSRTHLGARVATFAAGATFVSLLGASSDLDLWPAVAMLALVLLATWHPHTLMPLLAIAYLLVNWIAIAPATWTGWVLPAAVSLVTFHTGAALCAAVPAQAPLTAPLWRLTGRRLAIVSAVTAMVWVAAAVIERAEFGTGILPGLVGLSVLGVALAAHYRVFARPADGSVR